MAALDTSLHEGFLLHSTPDEYILQPNNSGRALVFNRNNGDIRLNLGSPPVHTDKAGKIVYGLFGVVPLPTADVLVLITSAKSRGKLLGHPVYLASSFLLLPVTPEGKDLTPTDGKLLSLIWKHLADGKFWFSYEWDLTRRLQAQSASSDPAGNVDARPMWETADDRFFWNKHLHSQLIRYGNATGEREISRFILPVVYGFFDLRTSVIQSHPVQFALISRRSRHRAGVRYFTRGVDAKGNPGNFNESEQILIATPPSSSNSNGPSVASFVQTRGSAPFYWAEIVNLIRVPDLIVMDKGAESHSAFRAHIDNQVDTYGKLLLLNLVKGKGREKHVKDAYEDLVFSEKDKENKENEKVADAMEVEGENRGTMGAVDYVHFDVHVETSGDRWHRVDEKTEELGGTLEDYGYFEAGSDPQAPPVKVQSGVVRTNCMDCLDRTNLMQTSVAKRALDKQARDFGLLTTPEQSIEGEEEFMKMFREVWSDHGNFIAKAYTGTGALRSDFTRTGVRTKKGIVLDKMTSGWRYIMNNHSDGYKQDGFDLITGAWQSHGDSGEAAVLLYDKRHWAVRLVPYIFWFSIVMIIFTLALRRSSSYSIFYPLTLYSAIFTFTASYMARNSVDYIAWPRLNYQPMLDAIYYEGPGARTTKGSKARGGGVVQGVHKGEKTILEEAIKAR
ncbi:hypothetical protein FRC04_000525 [Tulasnella sp. 424]|nr:hypothetical protein FRC04_000525 [Tulasnella sp. 424]